MAAPPVMNPPTPYTTVIPGGFFPGKMIRIQGFVPMHGQRFDVNLQTGAGGEIGGEDVAIHASVRLIEGYIARNSFQGGCWQEEMGDGGLPIQLGQRFEMLLLCEAYEYKIAVNGQHFCSFPPRVPFNRITHLLIEGDVQIEMIGWEGSAASAPPINGPPQYGAPVPPPQYTPQQQTYVQAPPPGATCYGSGPGLYPNLTPGSHASGLIPPPLSQGMPQPIPNPTHTPYPNQINPHAPFPNSDVTYHSAYPDAEDEYISLKAQKKIAKAEYEAEKKILKAQKKAAKKAAKAEKKAFKRGGGISTGAAIGAGIGVMGAATLAYAATSHIGCSSSSSCSSCSSSD